MEEKHHDDQEIAAIIAHISSTTSSDHGWQKVTYAKRQRKTKPSSTASSDSHATKLAVPNGSIPGADNVFRSLEKQSEDRRRRILEAQRSAAAADGANGTAPARSKARSDDEDGDYSDEEVAAENGKADETKKPVKAKKPKKPKVTVAEAAAKIDPNHLSAFLAEILVRFS